MLKYAIGMPKHSKVKSEANENRKIIKYVGVTIAIFLFYLLLLFNPLTGSLFQYPYYRILCGQKPVIGTGFMGKTYKTPDMDGYKFYGSYQELFCTENQAIFHGYKKG